MKEEMKDREIQLRIICHWYSEMVSKGNRNKHSSRENVDCCDRREWDVTAEDEKDSLCKGSTSLFRILSSFSWKRRHRSLRRSS